MNDVFLFPYRDWIFKLLFADERNLDLLTDFLQSVLQLPPEEYEMITIVDPHLLPEFHGGKLGILDVKITTKSKNVIDIEIQVEPTSAFRNRVVNYNAKMVTEQMAAGDEYIEIKRVISIIITDFEFVRENNAYHNCYRLRDTNTGSEFTDLIEINTLELPKLPSQDDGTALWGWMKFLSAKNKEELNMIAEKSPQIKKAVGVLQALSKDERVRLLNESLEKKEWDIAAGKRDAKAEGKAEGIAETIMVVAKKLFRGGIPVDEIMKYTGLTREEVEALR